MEAVAEMLKYNQNLSSLNLGRNQIRDHGIKALSKGFTKTLATPEEIAARKKFLQDMDKRKKEAEEEMSKRMQRAGKTNSALARPSSSLKDKRNSQADIQKLQKKSALANSNSTGNSQGTNKNPSKKTADKPDPAAGKSKTSGSQAPAAENRKGSSDGKGKKVAAGSKTGKKKSDEKEEIDETDAAIQELTMESNGQTYLFGNRTLGFLNLYGNQISEEGLNIIFSFVKDQDSPEGVSSMPGLTHIILFENHFDKSNPILQALLNHLIQKVNGSQEDDTIVEPIEENNE
ncbi:hypothetical protein ROZALSC1DRAFT_28991 [Rozella allomycis CSF55]|uniref:Uncharacterized protein n=1 Tax=Rozella allomycis (strain CSF55) TaxID=988480 RepID=A0A075ARF6_ROZAC|nr:hypothetical protein O9G_000956 [Rozella allomycis CSF55]RKP19401.1 hypothetical protein ROZALSC1DRAFT_28991 [Rozella allomycis CSF55]|eukprot:EPZ31311.1 hypothetical protein O9G_000956 [Rozella allomycis CSF55]